jgi:site-specific DNA recombinase
VQPVEIDPIAIERFTRLMREQLVSGDVAARKAYLSAIIDAIVVSDTTIRIIGSNDNIRATLGPNGERKPPWFVNLFRNGAPGRIPTEQLRHWRHA